MTLEERWAQIAEGMENEEFEEAKVRAMGIDGHEEAFGEGEALEADVDHLADGQMGAAGPGAGTGGGPTGEAYTESMLETGGVIAEVSGYEPEASMAHEEFEIVHGKDDRVRVFNTSVYPWRTICHLDITAANGSKGGCSGALIGPRTIATAGHCVYMHDKGGWVKQVRVTPGKNGPGSTAATEPYGGVAATQFLSVKGWTQSKSSNYDYGVIILPPDKKLGNTTGWMGLASLSFFSLLGLRVNNSGYPGDKAPYPTQWWNANNILALTDRRLYYQIDTYGGQSGSPVWRFKDNKRHIVGVHNTGGAPFNGAVRLAKPVFDNLVKWKNTYV